MQEPEAEHAAGLMSSSSSSSGVGVSTGNQTILSSTSSSFQCQPFAQFLKQRGIDDYFDRSLVAAFVFFVYGCVACLGVIGNGGALRALAQPRRLRSARNLFLLNLISTDLLLLLVLPITPWYAWTKSWQFGSFLCRLMPVAMSTSIFVCSWSLCAISIDKFLHLTNPTRAPVSRRRASLITFTIWAMAVAVNVPHFLSYGMVDGRQYAADSQSAPLCGLFCEEIHWQSQVHKKIYGLVVLIGQFGIPMVVVTFCYSRIFSKVSRDMICASSQFASSLSQRQRLDAMRKKRRVNYILIGMVSCFILCWLPLTMVNILRDFGVGMSWLNWQPFLLPVVSHLVAMSLVVWNPMLLFWLTRKQKRTKMRRVINSEALSSFASRISSFRIGGGGGGGGKSMPLPADSSTTSNNHIKCRSCLTARWSVDDGDSKTRRPLKSMDAWDYSHTMELSPAMGCTPKVSAVSCQLGSSIALPSSLPRAHSIPDRNGAALLPAAIIAPTAATRPDAVGGSAIVNDLVSIDAATPNAPLSPLKLKVHQRAI